MRYCSLPRTAPDMWATAVNEEICGNRIDELRTYIVRSLQRFTVQHADREDIAQDTIAKLLKLDGNLEGSDPHLALRKYAARAALHEVYKLRRAQLRREKREHQWLESNGQLGSNHDDSWALRRPTIDLLISACGENLPESDRWLLTAVYRDGTTLSEAAARLGIPIGTAKSRLRSARVRLTERFMRKATKKI